jgi:hypothetical protein
MPSNSTPPLPAAGGGQQAAARENEADAASWRREFQEWKHGRAARMQTSAQSWLGVMTTLLGLFSTVVVINRGTALSELPVGTVGRGLLFGLAVIAYGLAFAAVVSGALATFSGLGLGLVTRPRLKGWLGRLPDPLRAKAVEWVTLWSPSPLAGHPDFRWETYRDHQLSQADKLRRYLHRSRLLGIAAAFLAAVLALVVLGIGAFAHPSQSPSSVVVVHGGQVTCGSINVGADGRTRVGGREISRATQVVAVAHC